MANNEFIDIKVDNTELFSTELHGKLAAALEAVGLAAEGYAKRLCPVDTGRLRNSITHVVNGSDSSVVIGTNVEYAKYVEEGTSRQKPQPYLTPAATEHITQYAKLFKAYLQEQ
ncbi:MAG: HK97-gp10 family putative phage morphogenesis protein [Atopobiaceae bacterium]